LRRRAFLGSVGAAAAGVAVGLRSSRAEAQTAYLWPFYDSARGYGKPLLVATYKDAEGRAFLERARDGIIAGRDRELAVRLRLVELMSTDAVELGLLTKDRLKGPTSLAMIDDAPPRVVKAVSLDRWQPRAEFERLLRDAVPFTAGWLEARVALAQEHHGDDVAEVRRRIAAGQTTGNYGLRVPAVVALEALRRKGADRDRLLAGLLTPVEPKPKPAPKREVTDDCGLGMLLVSPLGARFADAFTKPGGES